MKTKMILKKLGIAIGILTILVSVNGISYAMVVDDTRGEQQGAIIKEEGPPTVDARQAPQYAEGEVLVKFKEGADPSSILKEAGIDAQGIERIHSIKPTVAKFRKDYKLEKDSEGWYPFLGKNYKEVSEIPDEEIFKEAYSKMPEVEKALYRSYKLTLPDGVTVEEVVEQLKNNPNVEYAEPNYIAEIQ